MLLELASFFDVNKVYLPTYLPAKFKFSVIVIVVVVVIVIVIVIVIVKQWIICIYTVLVYCSQLCSLCLHFLVSDLVNTWPLEISRTSKSRRLLKTGLSELP